MTTTTTRKQPGATTTTTGRATATTTVPPGLPPESCPDPRSCRHHTFTSGRPTPYPAGSDGRVRISYRINAGGLDTSTISVEQAEAAIAGAFATWAAAAPALLIDYQGLTSLAATPGDGINVVAFIGPNNTSVSGASGRPEFDMQLAPSGWTYAPCEQRDNSCTPVKVRNRAGTGWLGELQSIATHEAGHALWLHHVDDREQDKWMTMHPNPSGAEGADRFWSTLALGDVLGLRAIYPCSCPLPTIYAP